MDNTRIVKMFCYATQTEFQEFIARARSERLCDQDGYVDIGTVLLCMVRMYNAGEITIEQEKQTKQNH